MAKLSKKTIELLKTPATRQDSIDVLNSQLAQNAYYAKLKKYLDKKPEREKYSKDIEDYVKKKVFVDQELENSRYILNNPETQKKIEYDKLPITVNQLKQKAAQYIKYAKSEGKDKYHYLDLIPGAINFDAPFALFNSKIKPKGIITREFNLNMPGAAVSTWEYDPLAVTPVDMLTPEQKKLREKIYGTQSYSKGNVLNKINKINKINPVLENIESNENIDLNAIPTKQLEELNYISNEQPEMYSVNSKPINVEYTPEHYIDIVDISGKNPQRIPFESLEEKASYLKENPLLKLDQFTYADSKRKGENKKLKPETLAILKKKK
jgi:hypothetical protein